MDETSNERAQLPKQRSAFAQLGTIHSAAAGLQMGGVRPNNKKHKTVNLNLKRGKIN